MATAIIKPGEIEKPAERAPWLRLPEPENLFARRAERFGMLARGHALGEYLLFMREVARAQQEVLDGYEKVVLPDADRLRHCRQHGIPPLAGRDWRREPSWHGALRSIIGAVRGAATPVTVRALDRLLAAGAPAMETLADRLLAGDYAGIDLAAAPLAGAALQVYWAQMATALGREACGGTTAPNLCPVCASPPVASIVRSGGLENGQRYLHCSLCASEWHVVRIKCSNCASTRDIAYQGIEGDPGVVRAETCEECRTYLKIMSMERDPAVEPTADDLATLALDILMDQTGFMRSGPNFFLLPAAGASG